MFGDEVGAQADLAAELAAELAARFALELRACVVQDHTLLDVAALPFTRRFVLSSGARELSPTLVRAAWRRRAARSRASLESAAGRRRLTWSFEVVSSPGRRVPDEGQLAVLAGTRAPASPDQPQLRVIDQPGPVGERAIALAQSLAGHASVQRWTWVWSDDDPHAERLFARLRREGVDLLVVPSTHPGMQTLLDRQGRPLPCAVLAVG